MTKPSQADHRGRRQACKSHKEYKTKYDRIISRQGLAPRSTQAVVQAPNVAHAWDSLLAYIKPTRLAARVRPRLDRSLGSDTRYHIDQLPKSSAGDGPFVDGARSPMDL